LHAGIRAAARGRVEAQFFPQNHLLHIHAAHPFGADFENAGNLHAVAIIAALIDGLSQGVFLFLLQVALQVTRHFNNHLARVAVTLDKRIHNQANLIQSNMHGWIGDTAEALFQ